MAEGQSVDEFPLGQHAQRGTEKDKVLCQFAVHVTAEMESELRALRICGLSSKPELNDKCPPKQMVK